MHLLMKPKQINQVIARKVKKVELNQEKNQAVGTCSLH